MFLAKAFQSSLRADTSVNCRMPFHISSRKESSEYSERANPTIRRFSGNLPLHASWKSAGRSFLLVRSPVPPMMTMVLTLTIGPIFAWHCRRTGSDRERYVSVERLLSHRAPAGRDLSAMPPRHRPAARSRHDMEAKSVCQREDALKFPTIWPVAGIGPSAHPAGSPPKSGF